MDANEFNKRFAADRPNDTISKPFTKTVNERGHIVFSGAIKDIPTNISLLEEHDWNIQIEVCKDKTDAQQTQQQHIQQATQAGYSYIDVVDWHGVHIWEGDKPIPNNTKEVENRFIEIHPPDDLHIGYYVDDTTFWGRA